MILPLRWKAQTLRKQGKEAEARAMAVKVARSWAHLLLRLTGSNITVHGKWPVQDGAALIVSNHQGAFDIPILAGWMATPLAFVAKVELQKIPLIGKWMELIDCVFLAREDRRQAVLVAKQTTALLKDGHSMVVFPEGTRSGSDNMLPFKKGSLGLAARAGVPIVPVALKNSYAVMPSGKPPICKAEVDVYIGDPIDPSTLSKEELDVLHERVQTWIAERCGGEVVAPPAEENTSPNSKA